MTSPAKRKAPGCLVCGRPVPVVEIGRPRLYDTADCKRRADGAAREIDRLRALIPQWTGIQDWRVAEYRAEIRKLERIVAARHELTPRSETVAATVRALRGLAARMTIAGCEHAAELDALLAGLGRRAGS